MKILSLEIKGFRGIRDARFNLGAHDVIIGPNGAGKSTIIDALSLVFGRTRLVRELTEHDFFGSCPEATSRVRIVATLGGFVGDDPATHDSWFREGRAVPKWWNHELRKAEPEQREKAGELCAQIAFAARFDLEDLVVEQVRYFHDDDTVVDPFQEDAVQQIPGRLFDDIGYYVLPARRTWEATASFASELFRKTVAAVGGIPAQTILRERDRLRRPEPPMESDPGLLYLVERINGQLAQLLPRPLQFQLRVTATDSDSLLRALVPHYQVEEDSVALPVGRHGTGVLSLQTFILLLELGRVRRQQGKSFILAMEEPELHIEPGLQSRLVAQAVSVAEQTICTSHSPRLAASYRATSVQILDRRESDVVCTPLLARALGSDAKNAQRKLYHEDRPRVLEALMHYRVLIPEGRSEYEWFRLLADQLETGDWNSAEAASDVPPFGAVVGVIPTHDSAVAEVFESLRGLRGGLVPLVDGDPKGNEKVRELCRLKLCPEIILQWRESWSIEDAIGWILKGGESSVVGELKTRIEADFEDIDGLIALFKVKSGAGRLKTNYLAYQEVVSVVGANDGSRGRAAALLTTITRACLGNAEGCDLLKPEPAGSGERCLVLRISPS